MKLARTWCVVGCCLAAGSAPAAAQTERPGAASDVRKAVNTPPKDGVDALKTQVDDLQALLRKTAAEKPAAAGGVVSDKVKAPKAARKAKSPITPPPFVVVAQPVTPVAPEAETRPSAPTTSRPAGALVLPTPPPTPAQRAFARMAHLLPQPAAPTPVVGPPAAGGPGAAPPVGSFATPPSPRSTAALYKPKGGGKPPTSFIDKLTGFRDFNPPKIRTGGGRGRGRRNY